MAPFSNVKEPVTSTTSGSSQPQSRSTKKSSSDRAVSQKGRSVSQQALSDEMTKKGKRWTAEEEKILITEYRSQLSIQEIARTHGRSAGAIRSRINKMKEEGRL